MDRPTRAPSPIYLRGDGGRQCHPRCVSNRRLPVDIFPYIDIPTVSVVWPYYGLSPEKMEKRVVTYSQSYKVANFAARQASVDGIAHRCSITAGSPDQ